MREPALVVMAAGIGSRFGGLKQMTPVDGQGQILIDYSLYDARQAGFKKIVFVIRRAIEEDFKSMIGKRMERFFDVRYVCQEPDLLPDGYRVPDGRTKPWGTAHAVACAGRVLDGPFAVINADDFYGRTAFADIYDFLKEERDEREHAMVGYRLRNTLTEHGSVARGVCGVHNGIVTEVIEHTSIQKQGMDAVCKRDGLADLSLPGDTVVSMNLWGFQHSMLKHIVDGFPAFLDQNLPVNPDRCEYFLPSVVNMQIRKGAVRVRMLPTEEVWYGVTYQEDLEAVKAAVARMQSRGIYPGQLWRS